MDTATKKIASEFVTMVIAKFDVEKIILFGSRAREDYSSDSDFDFLIVMETSKEEIKQAVDIRVCTRDFNYPKDIMLLTPEHFNKGFSFKAIIEKEGVVLYERNN